MIGGIFSSYNETRRMSMARIYSDGTLDTTFLDTAYNQFAGLPKHLYNPAVEAHAFIYSMSIQVDGNIIIGGGFDRVGGGGDRADVRNRNNFARILGGVTPGPGNIGFPEPSYNADENAGSYFLTLHRDNGSLGNGGVTVVPQVPSPGPGSAVASNDFVFQAKYANPNYISTWSAHTWQLEDGTFGQNQGGSATVDPNHTLSYPDNDVFVNIIDNTNVDGNRALTFELHNPTDRDLFTLGGEKIPVGMALGRSLVPFTILDNDTVAPILGFVSTNFTVSETAGTATITLIRTNSTANQLTVQYQTSDGTAKASKNYKTKSGTLTFGPGVSTNTFTVSILHDGVATDDLTFNLSLFNLTGGAVFGISNATVTIIDADSPNGRLKFTSPAYATNENAGVATVAVRRGGGSQGTLSVTVATLPSAVPGTNTAVPGIDYIATTNVLTWNPNDVADKLVTIPLINNQIVDGNRSFNMLLYNPILNNLTPTNAVIGSGSNTVVTIVDDDAYGFVNFTLPSYRVRENGGPAVITVQRTGGIAQSVTVNFSASGGTAVAGTQYTPTNGILSFAPGEVAKSFTVPIIDDFITDGNRTINLSLFNASPVAALGPQAAATLTIVDDETFNQPPGTIDSTLDPATGFNADVLALALQTNGMILAGGDFTLADNLSRIRIARLNADGSLDNGFSSPIWGANDSVRALVSQTDTRVLVGGFFTNVNGTVMNHIARLNYNGGIDTTFNPGAGADNNVFALAETFAPDGSRKLFVGGAFVTMNSISRSRIARLNDDGTVDASFNPAGGANGTVFAVVPYPTNSVRAGQVLIGGDFTTVNGVNCGHVARLNAGGSVDSTFDVSIGANDSVRAIALQVDERIVIGGLFTNINSAILPRVARLNADGSVDATFTPGLGANDAVSAIALQPDGKILLGGQFTIYGGITRHRITRLNSDGTIDPNINFGLGADNNVAALLVQPDNKICLGGSFTNFDGTSARYFTRIYGDAVNGAGNLEFDSPTYGANETSTNVFVTIRRRGGTAGDATVTLSTSNITAIAGVNYSNVNMTVDFPPGEIVQTIAIPIVHDFLITPDLTFTATVSNPQPSSGPSIGGQSTALVTISNVDSSISFSSPVYSVNEDISTGVATIQINRVGSTFGTSSVDFRTTTNGTAALGTNYLAVTNTLTFAPGQSNAFAQVPVLHDLSANGDRTVSLQLSNAVGSLLVAPSQATLTVIDVERAPGQFVFSATNYAGGQSTGYVAITVVRTNGHSGNVTVHFGTADGSAAAGVDYVATNGTLSFLDGQTVQTFNVLLLDKPIVQNPRTFTISLSSASGGASVGAPSTVPVTIFDYHVGITPSSPSYSVSEDAGSITVPILRLNDSSGSLSVQYTTTDGAATNGAAKAGVNYTTTAGTLSFAPGETLKTITIPILQDHVISGNESFSLGLFNVQPPAAAQLLNPTSTVTILDTTVGFYFSNALYSVSKGGTNVTVTVIRTNAALAGTNTVAFATADGSAVAGTDYSQTFGTLLFTNGESSKDITIPIIQNTLIEGDLSFTISLSTNGLTNSALLVNPSTATIDIFDDNSGFSFSSPNYSVSEGGVNVTIPVVRTGVLSNTASISFSTADGTSVAGVNYFATNGTLTFTNGETVKYFTVGIIDDTVIQGDHTVLLTLSNPSQTSTLVAPSAAVITIRDNDGSLIVPAGSALTSESGPVNSVIDPGETVTMLLGLRNSVGEPTANLVATLLATNGVTPITVSQNYGVLAPGGPSASRPFTFTANGTNGGSIAVTLRLTDGASTNGFPSIATFTFNLGNITARYTNSGTITVNDDTNATPYPSVINVSGINGVVSKASVTLSNFTHTSAFDVDVLLAAPGGANMLLMANAGGHTAFSRANFTFDDGASTYLSQAGPLSTGTNKPTAYLPIAPFPSPAPAAPYATNLIACSNSNPNGAWSLYVADSRQLDTGGITNGWILSLNIASVVQPSANLGVAVSAAPATVVVGSNLVYSISVSNYGPASASGIVITNFLPPSVSLVSSSASGYVTNGNTLVFTNLGSLAANASLNFSVTVTPGLVGVISNLVSVAANESDPYPGDNFAAVTNAVISPSADLSVSLSGPNGPVMIGDNFVYSMTVLNGGPATATSVKVTNTLPVGVSFVSASSGGVQSAGKVTFDLGSLGSGVATNCSLTLKATTAGTLTDAAQVGAVTLDPLKANNFESVKTIVESEVVEISIQRSGNFLIISWPSSASGYVPETTTSLSSPSWTQITSPSPQTVGNQMSITLGLTNSSRYFRLRSTAP